MSNWWEEIPEDDPILESKARALSNALAHLPGTRATKIKWCLENVPLIEAEADPSGRDRGRQHATAIPWQEAAAPAASQVGHTEASGASSGTPGTRAP